MRFILLILSLSFFSLSIQASDCAKAVGPNTHFSEDTESDEVVTVTRKVTKGAITTFEEVEVLAHFEEASDEGDSFGDFSDGGDNLDAFGGL